MFRPRFAVRPPYRLTSIVLILTLVATALTLQQVPVAKAAPAVRVSVTQRGDFIVIGNTLGQECAAGTAAPVFGTVLGCGNGSTADSSPDVYWRSDSPSPGQAEAGAAIPNAQARTTTQLGLPAGSTITYAYLYWAARWASAPSGADQTATLDFTTTGATLNATAVQSFVIADRYQSVADVTSFVQQHGVGAYRVSDVQANELVDVNDSNNFAGWWMAVIYSNPGDPLRNITLFDGLDPVSSTTPQNTTLSGFLVPSGGIDAKLQVVAFDGDNPTSGDSLAFNGTALTNAQNPANNFFNSSHTYLGDPVSTLGDLPQLAGVGGSMSGIDLDVVDVTALVSAGQTSATINAATAGDVFFLAGYVLSITTFQPDLTAASKTATDLNGGTWQAGDQVEYTISVANAGNDTAASTVLTDTLDSGLTYVPNSLEILTGPNAGTKTDLAIDDQADYDAASQRVIFRLGTNADALQGGEITTEISTTLRFRATINAGVVGDVPNQAILTARGVQGQLPITVLTDGNGAAAGSPPTIINVLAPPTATPTSTPTETATPTQTPTTTNTPTVTNTPTATSTNAPTATATATATITNTPTQTSTATPLPFRRTYYPLMFMDKNTTPSR